MKTSEALLKIRSGSTLSRKEKIKLALFLSIPAMLSQMVTVVMEYIDAAMVGHINSDAAAAIGLVSTSTWLFAGVVYATVAGFTIQVAQCIGARRFGKARVLVIEAYAVTITFSVVVGLIGVLISDHLPLWLGGGEAIVRDAADYFKIFTLSLPIFMTAWLTSGMLAASGNMKAPGILESLCCVFDIIFNFFFIFEGKTYDIFGSSVYLPGAGLGVKGAALGTLAANAVTAVLLLLVLIFKTPLFRKNYSEGGEESEAVFEFSDIKKAAKLSVPIALERIAVCGAMVIITGIVAPLGNIAIAANSFAVTAEGFCYMPGFGIEDAATTLVGQSFGAGRRDLAFSFGKITIALGMIIMTVTGVLMFIFAPQMLGIMTDETAISSLGARVLRIEAFVEPFYAASIVVTGVLRGAGDTAVPAALNLISLWGVRIVLSLLLVGSLGLVGIWIAMAAELVFRGTIFLIRFFRKRWLEKAEKNTVRGAV